MPPEDQLYRRRSRRTPTTTVARLAPGQRIAQVALLLLSAGAVYLSSLSLYAGALDGLSSRLRDRLYTREAAKAERAALAHARINALQVWDSWRSYDDLAQIVLAEAIERGLNTKAGRDLMPEVLRLEAEALKRNPANAYAWARLAYARYVYNGPSRLVTEPLLQSIHSAPYEPDLLPARIALALKTEKYWTPEFKELFPQQLERAWLRQSVETVRAARLDGVDLTLRQKLDPARQKEFDAIVGGLRAPDKAVNKVKDR